MNQRRYEWTVRGRGWRAMACVSFVSLALAGCGGGAPGSGTASKAQAPAAAGATEDRVAISVDGSGFHPDRIPAHVGKPVTLALTRTTNETCATEVVFKSLDVRRALPLDQTVEVTITPSEKGEIAFACGMDMLKGAVVAE